MNQLLEEIERVCPSDRDVFELEPGGCRGCDAPDDETLWYEQHRERLRVPRDKLDPAEALARLGVLCTQAAHGPPRHAGAMCANALLAIGVIADKLAYGVATPGLLRKTSHRVDVLHRAGARLGENDQDEYVPQRVEGYAGISRGHLGRHLGDAVLLHRGVEQMLRSALCPHKDADALWRNVLDFANRLLREKHPQAVDVSLRVARVAASNLHPLLKSAFQIQSYEHLSEHWTDEVPRLVGAIHGDDR